MMSSSFSRRHGVSTLLGAAGVVFLSWVYSAHVWRGVVVVGAGDAAANGYYRWEATVQAYVQTREAMREWRVPNVFDLASRRPGYPRTATSPPYTVGMGPTISHGRLNVRPWYLARGPDIEYRTFQWVRGNKFFPTGWDAAGPNETRTLDPAPQVVVSGMLASPNPGLIKNRGGAAPVSNPADALLPDEQEVSPAMAFFWELMGSPGTALLLAIILAVSYQLWAKKISPDSAVISYAQFWENREYWRVFTASFSHVDLLHLVFNAISTWNMRPLEQLLGTFRFLCLTLTLVVTTTAVKILILLVLVKWKGVEGMRERKSLGFSCVLFAYMTYAAVVMREFCPLGGHAFCFDTWGIPIFGIGMFPVNLAPFALLLVTQVIIPKAGFIGHLAGIIMGYLMAWGALVHLSPPLLAGVSVIFMLQHSKSWAREMPVYSQLVQGWAGGDPRRVLRARALMVTFVAHSCLAAAFLCLFSWSSGLAELAALAVGYSVLQALKCCCSPNSAPEEHRFCLNLLKAYVALSSILLVSDLLSLGAILGQSRFLEWSGVSETSWHRGLILLVVAAVVHGTTAAVCVEGGVLFREGQTFLSSLGLKDVVIGYLLNSGVAKAAAENYCATSGTSFPGVGRILGAPVASLSV